MRRRPLEHDEEANHDRWLVSYADFITLMFAFFVVMYSISSVSEGKYRVLSDSLMQAFDGSANVDTVVPAPINLPIPEKAPFENLDGKEGEDEFEAIDIDAEPNEVTLKEKTEPEEVIDPVTEPKEFQDRVKKSMGEIADDIRYELLPFIDEKLISVSNTDKDIKVEIKSELLFPSGNARLVSKAIPVLSNLAVIFSTFNNPIQVEGFTDDQPIKTNMFPSNWELSAARAASVVHLFMRKGIDPKRMSAIGYAEFHPVADNNTEEGRKLNRRVVIVIPTIPDGRELIKN